jgi:3-oxoacyl-[acyl-carrier-protein] synthase III
LDKSPVIRSFPLSTSTPGHVRYSHSIWYFLRSGMVEGGHRTRRLDVIVANEANDRITEGVRKQMGMSPEKVPSNIASYGNTTAGTLPILYHELRKSGSVTTGTVVCFAAFGAGAHYGAALYREPALG